ncbi:hypothetical protein ABG067_008471, partial [Albugo candida]
LQIPLGRQQQEFVLILLTKEVTPAIDLEGDVVMGNVFSSPNESNDDVWEQDENFENNIRKDFTIPYDLDIEDDDIDTFPENNQVEDDSFEHVQ